MKKSALLLSCATCVALFAPPAAFALDTSSAGSGQGPAARAGKVVPFGGAYSTSRDGKRAQDIKPPSATICALREQTRGIGTTRQDASGKVQVFNDPSSLSRRRGDIYGGCNTGPGAVMAPRTGGGRPTTAYTRGNTLKAASDGYVNRSATSSMMPKKAPSMYDPVTGTLRPRKRPNAYQIYQE
ncbi:hypothetical protein [Zoogloea sp.]|uniref:hypothetical protein n=1 Tax=Zoogloea sp. TaxID=49181 RepID=UPI0035B4EEAD